MNSQEATAVSVRLAETIADEINDMYDQITKRAYEILRQRGGTASLNLEDRLAAERELIFKPEVYVEENDLTITVRVRIGKVRPLDIQLLLSAEAMVIRAEQSATAKRMFRTIQFPRRIDVKKAEVRYEDGYLILTA